MLLAFGQVNTSFPWGGQMAFGAVEKFPWTGEVFNDFTGDNEIELVAEVEIHRISTHHVKAFTPQRLDLILLIIQSHQISRLRTKNAVQPILGLACGERMVDTTNIQDPLACGKFGNECGPA